MNYSMIVGVSLGFGLLVLGAFITVENPFVLVKGFGLAFVIFGTLGAALVAYRVSELK